MALNVPVNTVNKGNQRLSIRYRDEARARVFNRLFGRVLPVGLYEYDGQSISREDNTRVRYLPMIGLISDALRDQQSMELRGTVTRFHIREGATINLATSGNPDSCDTSKPYIVLRFVWADQEQNWVDILAVGYSDDPDEEDIDKILPTDIILGKVYFQDSGGNDIIRTSNSFDFTRRTEAFIPDSIAIFRELRVQSSENGSDRVYVTSGSVNTSKGRIEVEGGEYPEGPTGITPIPANNGRYDIVYVDDEGSVLIEEGVATTGTPQVPRYLNRKVIGEIRRNAQASEQTSIEGHHIRNISETRKGSIAAEDYPIDDAGGYFSVKTIEAALQELAELVIDDETWVTADKIDWGFGPNQVSAKDVPVEDVANRYTADEVESALAEIAGADRTTETVKSAYDLADGVKTDFEAHEALDAAVEEVHGFTIVTEITESN